MTKLLCFLLLSLSLNAANTKDWPRIKRKVYVENKKQVPDINTYEWTRYIYKQCPDITLNQQIRNNSPFYKAAIINSTEKTHQKLKQHVKRWGKFLLGIVASTSGCFITIKGFQKYVNDIENDIKLDSEKNLVINLVKNLIITLTGIVMIPSFITSIKTIREYFKLRKTLEINKKMIASLQAVESTKI